MFKKLLKVFSKKPQEVKEEKKVEAVEPKKFDAKAHRDYIKSLENKEQ